MKRVYVAGAYNSDSVCGVLANMRRGIALSLDVAKAGHSPFCPWLDFQYGLAMELTVEQYQAMSMAWVEVSDCLLIVPGWENSVGTKREMARAHDLGIPFFFDLAACLAYCKLLEDKGN